MHAVDLLGQVREKSIRNIAIELAEGGENNPSSVDQLEKFFDLLHESVYSNDPELIISIIDEWLSEEITGGRTSLLEVTDLILQQTYNVAAEDLPSDGSRELFSVLMPIFLFANQYIHAREIDKCVSQVAQEFSHEKSSLERLDKSKSDFISIAAHELKTPLTLMEGYSAMLREIIEQKKIYDEHILSLLDGMDSGSRRLREIISDMIDVSLIDNNMLSLNLQPTWIYKILDRINQEVEDALNFRQLSLTVNRFSGDDVLNFYDGERLYQAISNVITNAIKYTPDGGKIVVEGRSIQRIIEIVIIDTGIGIDYVDQVKIFDKLQPIGDPAYHSSGKLKFKGGGPGLGLPIAKGIIEAHGGRIWVESEGYDENSCPGSTFHILLPVRTEPLDKNAANLFGPLIMHKTGRDNKVS
ncbi:MAG: HAMP domain-containing sensor histidine kinase [Anaerolineales bacterium]